MKIIKNFACNFKCVIVMLMITFFFQVSVQSFGYIEYSESLKYKKELSPRIGDIFLFLNLSLKSLTPFFGWIADAKIGRYKAIICSIFIEIFACVLISVTILLSYYNLTTKILSLALILLSEVIHSIGTIMLLANNLPFIMDQMVDASSKQLSTTIDWWFWSKNVSKILITVVSCYFVQSTVISQIFACCIPIALCILLMCYFKNTLNTNMPLSNPVKQIFQVVNHARKTKNLHNRSALTYWEENIPSRMNRCMDKYGGPFREEQVEDVKVSLQLILMIFIISFMGIMALLTNLQEHHMVSNTNYYLQRFYCLKKNSGFSELIPAFGIPLFYFVIKPIVHNVACLRRMAYSITLLQVVGVGIAMQCIGTLGFAAIELIGHEIRPNTSCMLLLDKQSKIPIDYNWMLIPLFLKTAGYLMTTLMLLKFIIAQAPYQMKGFLFGLHFGFTSLMCIVGYNAYKWFRPLAQTKPSCAFYYYITHTIVIATVLFLFAVSARYYRLRGRNNPVNFYTMVTEITAKYLNLRGSRRNTQPA